MPIFCPGSCRAVVVLLLGLAVPSLYKTASAAELADAQRTFQLQDGSMVHGQLVEYIPGERVVLLLPSGRVKTISWAELAPAGAEAPVNQLARSPQLLPVTVQTDRPVEIVEQAAEGSSQSVLSPTSAAPRHPAATVWLAKGGDFIVRGPGVTTEEFKLPLAGAVKLDITAGSRSRSLAGTTLLTAGSIVAGAGLVLLIGSGVRYLFSGTDDSAVGPPGWIPVGKQLLYSAGVLLPLGVIGLIAGSVSYVQGKTRVQVSPIYSSSAMRLPGGLLVSARGVEF